MKILRLALIGSLILPTLPTRGPALHSTISPTFGTEAIVPAAVWERLSLWTSSAVSARHVAHSLFAWPRKSDKRKDNPFLGTLTMRIRARCLGERDVHLVFNEDGPALSWTVKDTRVTEPLSPEEDQVILELLGEMTPAIGTTLPFPNNASLAQVRQMLRNLPAYLSGKAPAVEPDQGRIRLYESFGFPVYMSKWVPAAIVWFAYMGNSQIDGGQVGFAKLIFPTAIYLSVLLHEYGHALVGKYFGKQVEEIYVGPLGGYASYDRISKTAWEEFFTILAGPGTNFVIFAAFKWLSLMLPIGHTRALIESIGSMNYNLFFLNMTLPILPFDGGKMLHSVAWLLKKDRDSGMRLAWQCVNFISLGMVGWSVYLFSHGQTRSAFSQVVLAGLFTLFVRLQMKENSKPQSQTQVLDQAA